MTIAALLRSGFCLACVAALLAPNLAAARPRRPAPRSAAVIPTDPTAVPTVLDGAVPLPPDVPPPPALDNVSSYVLMDFTTGAVIAAKAPHLRMPPASLTKLMTVFLTYEALKAGTLKLDQTVPVSTEAWRAGGSRMFIQPGLPVTTEQLIEGLMVDSGNDAAVALAEAVAGTPDSFVEMMNKTAGLLDLADTHYSDVNGLPKPDLYTSAFDLARFSRVIVERDPAVIPIASEKYFTYNKIRQPNWNPVIFRDATVDGLKTGLTDESGHCIDATAVRDGRRLIAVVMGGPNWNASADDIEALLNYGYRFFANRVMVRAGEPVGAIDDPLRDPTHVPVVAAKTVVMTLPASKGVKLTRALNLTPRGRDGVIAKGAAVGEVAISLNGKTMATVPAVTRISSRPAGFEQRMVYKLKQLW